MSPHADPMSGLCSAHAVPHRAAMEHRRKMFEQVAQERLLHEHGLQSGGQDGVIAPLRASIGSAFIRMGERLRGRTAVAPA